MSKNPGQTEGSKYLIDHHLDEFVVDRKSRNLTPSTIIWYGKTLPKFRDFMVSIGIEDTKDIEPSHLRRFILHLGQHHKPGGVVNVYGGARAFLKWYGDEFAPHDWQNPLKKVKNPKRPEKIQKPMDLESFTKMLGVCPPGTFNGDRDRAILLFLLDTGVRKQELTDLIVKDVDLRTGEVVIREGKGRVPRHVFIGNNTRRALRVYLSQRKTYEGNDSLWVKQNGKGLAYSSIRQVTRRLAEKAGVPEPGLHDFRRAFAVNSLRNGMDVLTLQRLLGHKDLRVIHKYVALVTDDLKKSHTQYGIVDRLL